MHKLYVVTLIGLIFSAIPQSLAQSDMVKEKFEKQQSLNKAIEAVSTQFKKNTTNDRYEILNEQRIAKYEKNIDDLLKTRDLAEANLQALRTQQEALKNSGVDLHSAAGLERFKNQEEQILQEFVAYIQARKQVTNKSSTAVKLLRPLSERVQTAVSERALLKARAHLLSFANTAPEVVDRVKAVEAEYTTAKLAYEKAVKEYENAQNWLVMNDARRRRIANEVAAVQAKVAALQAELERIDIRLQRQAERILIEKGLMPERDGRTSRLRMTASDKIGWPVTGRISAGFADAAYRRYFGFEHKAIDIVVPQGTPVGAAADGVVFYVQNGGRSGYSYILIGHRGGYATLYGHVLSTYVQPAQEVRKGQVIGLSGGRPGSNGAGSATTGAHLHFEVTKNGIHIDPLTVL